MQNRNPQKREQDELALKNVEFYPFLSLVLIFSSKFFNFQNFQIFKKLWFPKFLDLHFAKFLDLQISKPSLALIVWKASNFSFYFDYSHHLSLV